MGISLYRLHVPIVIGRRAGFDVDTNPIFPQGVRAAFALVEYGAGDGEARAGTRCEVGPLLCSVVVSALSGVGSDPRLLESKP